MVNLVKHLAAFVLVWPLAALGVESVLPEPVAVDRYEKGLNESPFALATKVEAPAEKKDSFAANLVLTGLSRYPGSDGVERDWVSVRSRDNRVAFSLYGDEASAEPDAEGITIVKVNRSDENRKSSVTLKKGGEEATVEFSQESAPTAPPTPAGGVVRPGMPAVPGVPLPGGAPRGPGGIVRPTIQKPIQPAQMGGAAIVPGAAPKAGGLPWPPQTGVNPQGMDRRRIRVINSKP